jgi:hypothetical protein
VTPAVGGSAAARNDLAHPIAKAEADHQKYDVPHHAAIPHIASFVVVIHTLPVSLLAGLSAIHETDDGQRVPALQVVHYAQIPGLETPRELSHRIMQLHHRSGDQMSEIRCERSITPDI